MNIWNFPALCGSRHAGVQKRLHFESNLSEIVGRHVTLRFHDACSLDAAHKAIEKLLTSDLTEEQAHDAFNTVLVFYGVEPVSRAFFKHYLGPDAFKSGEALEKHVRRYQAEAMRLFPTFADAYAGLNRAADISPPP